VSEAPRPDTSAAPTLTQRWSALPQRWRVLIPLAALVLGFVLYTDWVWPIAERWHGDSERIESILRRARDNEAELPRAIREAVVALGPINVPRSEEEGSLALGRVANEVIGRHGSVRDVAFDGRIGSRLPPTALREIVGSTGQRVERVVGELRFTATPEQAVAVVRDLESSPEIESVSRIRLLRDEETRRVAVTLTIEAWILASGGGGRGRL